MTATAAQIAEVRRLTAESTTATYSDALIQSYIERYPLVDENGSDPYFWDNTETKTVNTEWIPTYDINAAVADIWTEKASGVAACYDFSADGANFSRSKMYEQFMRQAAYFRARRSAKTIRLFAEPGTEIL